MMTQSEPRCRPGEISNFDTRAAAFLLDGGIAAIVAQRLYVPVGVADADMAAPFPKFKALKYLNKQQTKSDRRIFKGRWDFQRPLRQPPLQELTNPL